MAAVLESSSWEEHEEGCGLSGSDISGRSTGSCRSQDKIAWDQHPNHHLGEPTTVECLIRLVDVNEINTAQSYASIKLLVWYFWKDPRLAGRPDSTLPANLWKPRLNLERTRISDLHETVKHFGVTETGDLSCLMRYAACINNRMDLRRFPFDIDGLEVKLIANSYLAGDDTRGCASKDWQLSLKGYRVEADEIVIQDWDVVGYNCNVTPGQGGHHDQVSLTAFVERNTSYYMFKIVFPLIVITIMSFLGFSMNVSDVNDRVAHSSGLLLATVGLLYVVSVEVPKTKYQTVIDKIIFLTILMLALTAIHAVVDHTIDSFHWITVTKQMSMMTVGIYFALYMAILGYIVIPPYYTKSKLVHRLAADDEEHRTHFIHGYKDSKDEWRVNMSGKSDGFDMEADNMI